MASFRFVLDTNVVIDEYDGSREFASLSRQFIRYCLASQSMMIVSTHQLKDMYYTLQQIAKKSHRDNGEEITPNIAAACKEYAWGCLQNALDLSDAWIAVKLRGAHNDFEDDLVLAAAERCDAPYVVTNDERLIKHAHTPNVAIRVITPQQAIDLMS